jgi:nucleoside-diphosphate-sugar epimerase
MSRSEPVDFLPYVNCRVDLNDYESVLTSLASKAPVNYIFYAARAPHGENGIEDVDANVRMLVNVVRAVEERSGSALKHVHLVEGTKWYGVHLGPYKTPAQEDDPRHIPPNFYYNQEDALAAFQSGKDWTWSASRPNVVCDFAPRRARNLTSILGAYAAICRELNVPFDFPGTEHGFETLTEVTDAKHLAHGVVWLVRQGRIKNRAVNFTNGDCFRWSDYWPLLARRFNIPCGRPRNIRLCAWMADKEPVWQTIVNRHGLNPQRLTDVALWDFADFVFRQDWDVLSDLTRLRQCGFSKALNSFDMFNQQLIAYEDARILPRPI